ncbi:MAG: TIGR02996 domain-containing protein [Myxococcota bacterium]|nr:TIGR02996 domain-containing protein [Myxococcota bacterium]
MTWDATLAELLAMWRAAPNRELADLIVEVGEQQGLAATWDDEMHPRNVTALLACVLEKGSVHARTRLDEVASWPRDPRIDRWIAAQYAHPPTTSTGGRPFWTRLCSLAKTITDTTAANTILKARTGWVPEVPWQAFLAGHVDRIRAPLVAAHDVPFERGAREKIEDVRAALRDAAAASSPAHQGDAAALLAAVLENPDDDGARLVLGDVLQEQGDPRGELIALQLGAGDAQRERALVKQHAHHLLGALHGILKDYTFARGFLARATIKAGSSSALEHAMRQAVGHPLWATVEHVEGGTHELVMHPVMRSLRSLARSSAKLASVAKLPRLETYMTRYFDEHWLVVAKNRKLFAKLRDLDLVLPPNAATRFLEMPLVEKLDRLQLRVAISPYETERTTAAFALLARMRDLRVRDATLRLVRSVERDWYSAFHFEAGEVEVTTAPNMNAAAQGLAQQDIERGLATLQAR